MKITKFVDLSLPLNDDTPIYPGDPKPHFEVATTVEHDGYNLSGIYIGSQSGSHVDSPYHFSNDGTRVDHMGLDMFFGKGMKLDFSHKQAKEAITLAEVEPYLDQVADHPFVLFQTNWTKRAMGTDAYFDNPYVSGEVAEALVAHGIKFLGIDTINADFTGGTEFPVHDLFSKKNLMIGENWAHFEDITSDNFYLASFPLLMNTDGSPVRPVAIEVE